MRWGKNTGKMRYKFKFPILPFSTDTETRWLEPCWILQTFGITVWLDVCFADWRWRDASEGTWEVKQRMYDNYIAECTLCGYQHRFDKLNPPPEACPKCGWEKEGEDSETEL